MPRRTNPHARNDKRHKLSREGKLRRGSAAGSHQRTKTDPPSKGQRARKRQPDRRADRERTDRVDSILLDERAEMASDQGRHPPTPIAKTAFTVCDPHGGLAHPAPKNGLRAVFPGGRVASFDRRAT